MSEWKIVGLGDLAANEPGSIAIGPFGSRMKAENYISKGVPVIRGTNISSGKHWKGDWVFISNEFADTMPNCTVQKDDLVFPHRGSIGEVAIVDNVFSRYILSTSLMKFRADLDKVLPLYLFYYFRSPLGRAEIMRFSSQVGTPGIGQPLSSLRQFRVPLPPSLGIQKSIARILSSLDDKIELNRRMNETLESMARAIFKDWFVDFGPTRAKEEGRNPYLPEHLWSLFPGAIDPQSGLPMGWQKGTVGEYFNLIMGQSPPGNTYNDIGEGLPFFQGRTDFGFRFPENRKYCSAPTRTAELDDTLISVRAPVGDINMAFEKCCIGRGVSALRHKSKSRSFTYYSAWSIQTELHNYEHTGTVFGAINRNQFMALSTVEPDARFVKFFDDYVAPMDNLIKENVKESRTLAELRDRLLPKLMSGEIRVKDAEQMAEEVT
jgi:type I restriction enzyme S subunit